MKVKVDQTLCIGCGICEGDLPEVFVLGDSGVAEVIKNPIDSQYHDQLPEIVSNCPTTAISIEKDEAIKANETTTHKCCCCENSKSVDEEPTHHKTERNLKMKIKVDQDLCIGCGICEGIAPEVFSLETEPYAVVLLDPVPEEFQAAAREAAEACPEAAIVIED